MAMKLSTTLTHITTVPNSINSKAITEFYNYMERALELLKTIKIKILRLSLFMKFLGPEITFLL